MSSDSTSTPLDCTCDGCGTGTTCVNTNNDIKAGSLGGTYVYAAPDLPQDGIVPPPNLFEPSSTIMVATDDTKLRVILQDEIIRDLLQRVQRLEKTTKRLKKQNLEFQGSLDALVDIMDDEGEDPARTRETQLREEMQAFLRSDEPLKFLRNLLLGSPDGK